MYMSIICKLCACKCQFVFCWCAVVQMCFCVGGLDKATQLCI